MMAKIHIGDRYEVKPRNFHRAIIGKAVKIDGEKLFFELEYCDIIDRGVVKENELVEAEIVDVKKQLSNQYFFS